MLVMAEFFNNLYVQKRLVYRVIVHHNTLFLNALFQLETLVPHGPDHTRTWLFKLNLKK